MATACPGAAECARTAHRIAPHTFNARGEKVPLADPQDDELVMGHMVALNGDPGARVTYGWNVFGMPYAHAIRLGTIRKTFVGPWSLHRAIRWLVHTQG